MLRGLVDCVSATCRDRECTISAVILHSSRRIGLHTQTCKTTAIRRILGYKLALLRLLMSEKINSQILSRVEHTISDATTTHACAGRLLHVSLSVSLRERRMHHACGRNLLGRC